MDAVSDRDFALEFLAFASILAVHLSRLAEEYVIWSSQQFAYVKLGDHYHGFVDYAAEEKPGCRRTDPRKGWPRNRGFERLADRSQGYANDLRQGYARG